MRWDEARLQSAEDRLDALKAVWWDIAQDSKEAASNRTVAADKLYDREAGKAMQRQELNLRTVNPDDLTDDELAAIAAGRGRTSSGAEEGQD